MPRTCGWVEAVRRPAGVRRSRSGWSWRRAPPRQTGRGHVFLVAVRPLLDVGADDAVPLLGNDLVGSALLVERREDGLFVSFRRRELSQHVRRNLAALGEVVEADRVAIAFQPA